MKHVDERLIAMRDRHKMYVADNLDALESLVLQLIESEYIVNFVEHQQRIVTDTFYDEVKKLYPNCGNMPWLIRLVSNHAELPEVVYNVAMATRQRLGLLKCRAVWIPGILNPVRVKKRCILPIGHEGEHQCK